MRAALELDQSWTRVGLEFDYLPAAWLPAAPAQPSQGVHTPVAPRCACTGVELESNAAAFESFLGSLFFGRFF